MQNIPGHLKKYIVEQHYEKYTPVDQAVWRYILRQLKKFLSINAHESYLEGLEKTGIEIEQIPIIEKISEKLKNFGWRALPVSGFIPPAAFMELQSLGVLPIACDMRSIDHLLYTPAPDIVHEAAGHAPILVNEEYAQYLKQYAQVAKKAIMSKQDLAQYEVIRELSDLKENPNSTETEIRLVEEKLKNISQQISFISEAAELSRMNWWTAEYGLIGDMNSAKIFGAGLLSSVGESKWCLSEKVKKIPLTLDCVRQSYDITEPQPQLFVAQSFKNLLNVLSEFSETMAYKVGGTRALDKMIQSETINTAEFENGLQISGALKNYHLDSNKQLAYLQFNGPTQLCHHEKQIMGHGSDYHQHGYGTPVGEIEEFDFKKLIENKPTRLKYKSGVQVSGVLKKILKLDTQSVILTFDQAHCEFNKINLFQPEWGLFDILLVQKVVSGFGGPADREAFGEVQDFAAKKIQSTVYTDSQKKIFSYFEAVRLLRQNKKSTESEFQDLFLKISQQTPYEWLLFIELVEIAIDRNYNPDFLKLIYFHLEKLSTDKSEFKSLIDEGLHLAQNKTYA